MLLELKDIKKYFSIKKGLLSSSSEIVKAVDGVSLSVKAGENLGLVGESGSGKTTLARIMIKLQTADSGTIYFEGEDISRAKSATFRKNIQMVFQDPYSSLDPRFRIRQVLDEAFVLLPNVSQKERTSRMETVLKAVQLKTDILERYPHEFSGGERQRIAIARALIVEPKLLILDEAVSSLDALVQEEILHLLKDLNRKLGVTYIFITHNLRVVQKVCQKIAVMYKGKIIELAQTQELFREPMHPYTQELLEAAFHYRSQESNFLLESGARLIEKKPGHFVLQ